MVFFIIFSMNFYKNFEKMHIIGAHRGYRSIRPENTIASFEAAIGHFDFIELDVQPSNDGALMILHDDTLERTTNIEHISELFRPHRLVEYDYELLRSLDAGTWFTNADPFGAIAKGIIAPESIKPQRIPLLAEVLTLCSTHNMPLNIEIKDSPECDADRLLNMILEAIKPFRDSLPLLISSFNHRYLATLHDIDPDLELAANVEQTHPPRLAEYLSGLGVCAYHVDEPLVDTTPVNELDDLGISCGVFTVNDPGRQKQLFDIGFRSIFADTDEG